jgi:hypothetical protein
MLGHPGISAFEYAGAAEQHHREERAWEKATEETTLRHVTERHPTPSADLERQDIDPQPVASSEPSEPQQPQTPVDEYTITQRRRGTFVNHTPRNHEFRLSSKLSHRPSSEDESGRLYMSCKGSSDDNTENSKSYSGGQHSSFGSLGAEQSVKTNASAPIEFESKDIPPNPLVSVRVSINWREDLPLDKIMHPLPTVPTIPIKIPRQRRSQSSSAAASIKSSHTGVSKRSLRTFLGRNASLDACFPRQPTSFDEPRPSTTRSTSKLRPQAANSKRRRRQTPHKVTVPLVTDLGRHAPLEPLVLHHRREVTGSDVDPLPPHVDIDNDISEAATLLAINEYFDSQEVDLTEHAHLTDLNEIPSAKSETPLNQPHPSSLPQQISENYDVTLKNDTSNSKESTPSLPERNPERLSRINTPISPRPPKSASSLSIQSDFTSAAKGQYSPYDERCDTVPKILHRKPLPTSSREHGRSISASGKLAPRIPGHDELASSRLNDFNYFLRMTGPSPTHETKAVPKKKKKGLKVMKVRSRKGNKNPTNSPSSCHSGEEQSQVPACCLEERTKAGGVKHLRIKIPGEDVDAPPWTDAMMQPLARADVERAINPLDSTSLVSTRCSPRPAAVLPKSAPVGPHTLLLNRKEQTRSRKIRDLKKAKGRTEGDAEGGAEEYDGENRVKRLEWLVEELAEGLKTEAGIEGDMGPEEVLEAWREVRDVGELS